MNERTVLLVLNLGRGCTHCNRQLDALERAAPALREAGVTPEVVVWDRSKRELFRSWRAYDDFEDQPLHGTYLIGNGRVLWEDVGSDPFMLFESFLVGEARRLLGIWGGR